MNKIPQLSSTADLQMNLHSDSFGGVAEWLGGGYSNM